MENIEESKTIVPTIRGSNRKSLHNDWNLIQPVKDKATNRYEFGHSRHMSKMIEFLKEFKFNREDFDYYFSLPPKRLEDEEYEDYKIRRQFCDKLLKFKNQVRAFVQMNLLQNFMDEQKKKKELADLEAIKMPNTAIIPETQTNI